MKSQLLEILRPDQVLSEPEDLIPYGFDGTAMFKETARAVVFPENTSEVSKIVNLARSTSTPIVTRGSGTGLSGGSIPTKNGIVLCLVKMNSILELDTENLTLTAEAGTITQAIDEAASQHGLIYPPDPGSMKISTIGGNVANNSGGLRGLKYGVTRNYIMGMEVVLPDGEIVWLGNKCVKDVAGYSLKDLFVGSEGTLGIVTKVLIRLLPKPETRKTMLATFNDIEQAAQTVSDIIVAKIIPCTLEFLDQATIRCVEDFAKIGLPTEAKALLLMESDGPRSVVEAEASKMQAIAQQNQAISLRVAKDNEEASQLATARRAAFSALARIRPTTILEDITVPRNKLAATVKFIESVAQKHNLQIANFGHMGDGNLHPTFLTNERNTEEIERVETAMHEIFEYTLKVGGTITGEHGVGLAKKEALKDQFADASYGLLQTIKRSLDPDNLLNPGKIFDV